MIDETPTVYAKSAGNIEAQDHVGVGSSEVLLAHVVGAALATQDKEPERPGPVVNGALPVGNPGQLHDNLILSLLLNGSFPDPELINAIADHLYCPVAGVQLSLSL